MEIQKLEKLKASKMKELVLKKRLVLEDVYRQAHMEPDPSTTSDKTNALIDSGTGKKPSKPHNVFITDLCLSIELLFRNGGGFRTPG